jgi:hypothetical protein
MNSTDPSNTLAKRYSKEFYDAQIPDSVSSAETVLTELFRTYKPNSVLDIGCGQGTWLSVAQRLGVKTLHGLDGPWVRADAMLSRDISFQPINMEESIPVSQKYEMAMSVEVAEHLSVVRAKSIVEALCQASDLVLFGAAVIGQGGENHINEQRQSYWVELFEQQGFRCFDSIRPTVWNSTAVAPWYRQNTLVYVNQQRQDLISMFAARGTSFVSDIIHPEMFEKRVESFRQSLRSPSLRFCIGLLLTYCRNRLGFGQSQ